MMTGIIPSILSLSLSKAVTVLFTVRIYRSIYVLIKTHTSIYEGVKRESDSIDSIETVFRADLAAIRETLAEREVAR